MKRVQLFIVLYDINMQKLDGRKCDGCGIVLHPSTTVELCPECANSVWVVMNIYENGFEIKLPTPDSDVCYYVAGAKKQDEKLLSAGGRVLGVTAVGNNLSEAIDKAYAATKKVQFENGFYRSDIGQRALKAYKG